MLQKFIEILLKYKFVDSNMILKPDEKKKEEEKKDEKPKQLKVPLVKRQSEIKTQKNKKWTIRWNNIYNIVLKG